MSQRKKLLLICVMAAACELERLEQLKEQEKIKKKARVWTKPWIARRDEKSSWEELIKDLELECPIAYKRFLRMSPADFQLLLRLVGPYIKRNDTTMRKAISPEYRLMITLRFLATGDRYRTLQYIFRVPHNTISGIVPETCAAIFKALQPEYMKFPTTPAEWENIAEEFENKWNFPNCIGSLNSKHIKIAPSPHNAAHNIVLMALADAQYKFTYVDIGCNGRICKDGVFRRTVFFKRMIDDELNLPEDKPLPGRNTAAPYLIIADNAFAMNKRIMTPFPHHDLFPAEEMFNYHHNRVHRVVENAFGILLTRFSILRKPIALNPEKAKQVIMACCVLHNFLMEKSTTYITPGLVDSEMEDGIVIPGDWRDSINYSSKETLQLEHNNASVSEEAKEIQQEFAEYFDGEEEL